jgi:hypothetical protein
MTTENPTALSHRIDNGQFQNMKWTRLFKNKYQELKDQNNRLLGFITL